MDNQARRIISSLAADIISEYGLSMPFDIKGFVNNLGGEVIEGCGVLGEAVMKCGDCFQIRVSAFQDMLRERFAIAHELGHLFLHMGFKTNREVWDSISNLKEYHCCKVEQEYQANEFAASLLMPEEMYKQFLSQYAEHNKINLSLIAEKFQVSLDAAANRGKCLSLLKREL